MVYTCCVPQCKTGYKSNDTDEKIALFQFPKDDNFKKKWINSIPRKDWVVTSSHRVCKLHFEDTDFVQESCDRKTRRRNARSTDNYKGYV